MGALFSQRNILIIDEETEQQVAHIAGPIPAEALSRQVGGYLLSSEKQQVSPQQIIKGPCRLYRRLEEQFGAEMCPFCLGRFQMRNEVKQHLWYCDAYLHE